MSPGTDLEGTRAHEAVSDPSYSATEYTELANHKENMIDALPPLLRSAGNPKGIILDLIYERMRPVLQLPSLFHTVSEEFFVKIWQANIVDFHNRSLFAGGFAQNDTGITLKNDAHIHRILPRLNLHAY
jgi:hypothetical protein